MFESCDSEGAVLAMPEGANSQDLRACSKFKDYMACHLESWYKLANDVLGLEVPNGCLRLVTGCDKSPSWGIATFSNATEDSNFRLQFKALAATRPPYAWEHSGMAEVRVGPGMGENEGLASLHDHPLCNQTLIVRTFTATLSEQLWTQTFSHQGTSLVEPGAQDNGSVHSQSDPEAWPNFACSSSTTSQLNIGATNQVNLNGYSLVNHSDILNA